MPEPFDPYFEWLGIENGGQPPDHYRLLGLQPFESDPDLIARAADAAKAEVRRIRPGPRLDEWSRLLDRLDAAKLCLLDPSSKEAYDASLTSRPSTPMELQQPMPATPPVVASVAQPFVAPTAEFLPIAAGPGEPAESPEAGSSWAGPIITGLVVLAIGLGASVFYVMHQRNMTIAQRDSAGDDNSAIVQPAAAPDGTGQLPALRKASSQPASLPKEPAKTPNRPAATPEHAENKPVQKATKETTKPAAEKPKPAVDANKAAVFAQAAADARRSLAQRDMTAAGRHIKLAAANAQTPEDTGQVDRLETMLDNLTQFWNGIRATMAKLQPIDEIVLKNTPIVVVESGPNELVVKDEGRIRRYKAEDMPVPLVMALADQSFGKEPGSKAIIGTFLAIDPGGDRALAKRYWQEAARAGIDCEKLLRELDAASPGRAGGKR